MRMTVLTSGDGGCMTRLLILLTAVATQAAAVGAAYKAPRTAYRQPDLQGVWNYSSDVPLERPKEFADKKFVTRDYVVVLSPSTSMTRGSSRSSADLTWTTRFGVGTAIREGTG